MQDARLLKEKEYKLIKFLLKEVNQDNIDINELKVVDMLDGGMGSLYFMHESKSKDNRQMYKSIVEKQFEDIDGIPILVCINVDTDGDLFELDIWRVDFNPIKNYPLLPLESSSSSDTE